MHRQQLSSAASTTYSQPFTVVLTKRQPFTYINNVNILAISHFCSLYIIDSEMYVVSNKDKAANCSETFTIVDEQLCEAKQLVQKFT